MDGRSFNLRDAEALAARLNDGGQNVLIDYDHRSHYDVDDGGSSEAAGWLTKFEARDGALWGLVEWTEEAARKITEKLYRFISPEFMTAGKDKEVSGLAAVALVNRPAFDMPALASRKKETIMLEKIALALGLDKDADEEAILAAIEKRDEDHKTELAAANAKAKTPSTDDFMPRADYDAVLARAEKAEDELKEADKKAFDEKVEVMVTAAIKAGKITPASKEHYVALCTDETSFETTRKALEVAPEVIADTGLKGKPQSDNSDPKQLAAAARKYQKEQSEAGVEITIADAVDAIEKGTAS